MRAFFTGLRIQFRVWGALFLREMQTRWGRRNLGFAWLFAEPLVFAFPVLMVWHLIRPATQMGIPMNELVWTGYLPLLIFRHVTGRALFLIKQNSGLLYHRLVTPLDLFVGLIGLEAIGNLAAAFFSFVVFYLVGFLTAPDDTSLLIAGFLYTTWWSLATALIVDTLSERSELVQHIWTPFSYLYVFFSGFPFMAAWLPPSLRQIALTIDPPLHCYEMVRAGMYGHLVRTYYDTPYLTYILATMTLIGLWLMRHVRHHVEVP